MKLTGELKDKVESAETMDAKKDIIAEAGMELTDDELANVAGGQINSSIYQQVFDSIIHSSSLSGLQKSMLIDQLNIMATDDVMHSDSEVRTFFRTYGIRV